MKPLQNIEFTRLGYHLDTQIDTVQRSSLLAPELRRVLPGFRADVGFSNHFLLKRGYEHVACRVTAVGLDGRVVASRTHRVDEPRVYVLELSEMSSEPIENYIIEFHSSENLYIPFPAAVVNHRSSTFLNSVHSYNRILNDVFEDDAINAVRVREASIDVLVDDDVDTFALFTAGPTPCRGSLEFALERPGQSLRAEVPVDLPRLTNQWISLEKVFGEAAHGKGGLLTVQSPAQPMFYGRLLAGMHSKSDNAIAANHSFYDCSDVSEYCSDGRPSERTYPLIDGFGTSVRLYPIFSPSELCAALDFFDERGREIGSFDAGRIESPSVDAIDLSVDDAKDAAKAAGATALRFRVWPTSGGTPSRVNHQIVWHDPGSRSPLAASVAISLRNPNHFKSERKAGLIWGQCAVHQDLDTRVGLVFDEPALAGGEELELSLLSEQGEVYRNAYKLAPGAGSCVDPAKLVPDLVPRGDARPHYLWYWAESPRPDLAGYSVTRHHKSLHCSGEHYF